MGCVYVNCVDCVNYLKSMASEKEFEEHERLREKVLAEARAKGEDVEVLMPGFDYRREQMNC